MTPDVNGAIQTNVLLSSVNPSVNVEVNTEAKCETSNWKFQVDRSLYLENGEWNLEGSTVFSYSRDIPGQDETFPAAGFSIKLRRKPTYFVLNVIVPR